jgi:quinol-cytochrome oxidoreductase complex cytochrome b subunit
MYPRSLWISGVVIFTYDGNSFLWVMFCLGVKMSFGLTVTNLFSAVPFVGEPL